MRQRKSPLSENRNCFHNVFKTNLTISHCSFERLQLPFNNTTMICQIWNVPLISFSSKAVLVSNAIKRVNLRLSFSVETCSSCEPARCIISAIETSYAIYINKFCFDRLFKFSVEFYYLIWIPRQFQERTIRSFLLISFVILKFIKLIEEVYDHRGFMPSIACSGDCIFWKNTHHLFTIFFK